MLTNRTNQSSRTQAEKFDTEKLKDGEVRNSYQVLVSNKFSALENLDEVENIEDVNKIWETMREKIISSAKESIGCVGKIKNKPWFDDECADLVKQRQQARIKWLQDPNQINAEAYSELKRRTSSTFRSKKRVYMKEKINEIGKNNANKDVRNMYRGIREIRGGHQSRTDMIKDENGNLLGDTKSILNRWRNYFNNVLNINDREEGSFNENTIHTAEPFIVEPDELDIKFIIEELKSHKAPGIDGIPAELFKSGGPSLRAAVHKLILAIWKQEKKSNKHGS